MSYKIILQKEAIEDMQTAYDWYEIQLATLGDDFLNELYSVFDKLKENPQHYSIIFNEFRSVGLKRFPYRIVYKIDKNIVYINMVKHKHQNRY